MLRNAIYAATGVVLPRLPIDRSDRREEVTSRSRRRILLSAVAIAVIAGLIAV